MTPPARVAVVTGASRGLGAMIAGFLSSEGFALVLTARGGAALSERLLSLRAPGRPVEGVVGDVSDPAHRREIRQAVDRLGGRVDLLVNNASELGPSPLRPLVEVEVGDLARVYATNVAAPIALVAELGPALRRGHGLIVNITSDAAVGAYARWGPYGASKAALELATRTLAVELREWGVSAVVVDPGDLRTAMHQAAFPGEDISDRPLPEVTLPFWAWLLGQDPSAVNGGRFRAQADRWELPA